MTVLVIAEHDNSKLKAFSLNAVNAASKINSELGWEPSLQFEEGLNKTVDWYMNNQKWLDNVTSGEYQKYYDQKCN